MVRRRLTLGLALTALFGFSVSATRCIVAIRPDQVGREPTTWSRPVTVNSVIVLFLVEPFALIALLQFFTALALSQARTLRRAAYGESSA